MKHIIGLSGGKDSTAMALRLAEVEPRDYTYIFTPTGNEADDLQQHIERLECMLKMSVVRITNGTLESHMDRQNALPSHKMRWCTRVLKIEPTIAYFKSVAPAVMYVGLRADEEERGGIYGDIVTSDFPLRRWGWTETDVMDYLFQRGVSVPSDTGCKWCYEKRLSQWRRLYRDDPKSYAAAVEWERRTGHTFRSPSRDTQPAGLVQLGAKFSSGYIPRGDSDQMEMFDNAEFRRCRVCSL